MTFNELKNMVWTWLDDPTHGYFTDNEVSNWLNNAQREAQKQLIQSGEQWYTKRVSTALVVNEDTYALPDDFLKMAKFEILLSGTTPNEVRQAMTPVSLVGLDRVSMTTGTPCAYTIRKNCVVIRPIPDNTQTLYMDYAYLVSPMIASSDIPDVPQQYQEYLAVLASIDGFLKDQRDPSPMLTKKDYYLALMKQDDNNRNVDYPRTVNVTDDDSFGYLF